MSAYQVVELVSNAFRRILWDAFEPDADIRQIVPAEQSIVFTNPTETARDSDNRLSLWLHYITENEFAKNRPLASAQAAAGQPATPDAELRYPPLALNLFFLVTPFAPTEAGNHLLIGKTMQTFYDNAIVLLGQPGGPVTEELRTVFSRRTLEENTRIWEALQEAYRLSVCYEVRVARVDSQRDFGHRRVLDRSLLLAESDGAPIGAAA